MIQKMCDVLRCFGANLVGKIGVLFGCALASIVLVSSISASAQATRTWTGAAGTLWSQSGNWSNGVPQNGDTLVFPQGAANLTNTNDLTNLSLNTINFGSPLAVQSYVLSGNPINFAAPNAIIGMGLNEFNFPMQIRGSDTTLFLLRSRNAIDIAATGTILSRVDLRGPVNIGANPITMRHAWIAGGLNGSGNITIRPLQAQQGGYTVVRGATNYSGTISAGAQDFDQELYLDAASMSNARLSMPSGYLRGNGSIGDVTVSGIQPGQVFVGVSTLSSQHYWGLFRAYGQGELNVLNLTLVAGASPNTSTPGASFELFEQPFPQDCDRITVSGTTNLGNTAALSVGYSALNPPTTGRQFILIRNDASAPISGQFKDLPEGATVVAIRNPKIRFSISYRGGDGNDVVLTTLAPPPVNPRLPTVSLAVSPNPISVNAPVTLSSVVTPSGSGPMPTGTVTWRSSPFNEAYSRIILGSATLVNGRAQLTLPSVSQVLGFGLHQIYAVYQGDTNYESVGVDSQVRVIFPGTLPTVSVTVSPNPSLLDQPTTISASLSGPQGTPSGNSGSVNFYANGVQLGGVASLNGLASLTTTLLPLGSVTIFALYSGNSSYTENSGFVLHNVRDSAQAITLLPTIIPATSVAQPSGTLQFIGSGGTAPYVYFVSAGSLPPGLILTSGGVLSGTPTVAGTYNFTVASRDAADITGTRSYTVLIAQGSSSLQTQTISFTPITSVTVGTTLNLSATASSGLAVNFSSSTPSVCSIGGNQLTALFVGTCTVVATQTGNASFSAATTVTQSIAVSAALSAQTIAFTLPSTSFVGATPLTLTASGGASGNAVMFASTTPNVCSTTGSNGAILSFLAGGACRVNANQAGSATHSAAATVTGSIAVSTAQLANRYRLYVRSGRGHLYTTDLNEYEVLPRIAPENFVPEGIAHKVFKQPITLNGQAAVPYYRLFIKTIGQHFWTTDENEYRVLRAQTAFFADDGIDSYIFLKPGVSGTIPLYRLVLANTPLHVWTTDQNEFNVLSTRGWIPEGSPGNESGVTGFVFPP